MTSAAPPQTDPSDRADRRTWIGLAALAIPCMLVTMDLTVLFLALPKLTADLAPSATQILWITDIYGFLIAGALIVMGALGDRVGRRRVLLIGAAAFGAASLLAALSTSAEMLIAARAIQGLAGATLVPSVMSLVFTMFRDERQRTSALGIVMSCFVGGAALGPLLGGALLEFFDWNVVFLVNVPVTLLLLAIGPRLLPEFRNPDAGRVDGLSAVLLVAAILPAVYGVKHAATHGVDPQAVLTILAGVALGVLFAVRQLRLADPLLDVRLFRARAFTTALGSNVLGAFVMYGIFFFTSQWLQRVAGLSPLESGLWSLPGLLAMIVVSSAVVPRLAARVRPGYLLAGGMAICAAGFALLTQLDASDGLALLVVASTITSIGIAPGATLGTALIVGSAPVERAGAASGVAETGNELGGALGIALLGTLGTALAREQVADGASFAVAFTNGTQVVAGVCAVAMLAMAVVAARFLRHVPVTAGAEPHSADVAAPGSERAARPQLAAEGI